MAHQNDYNKGQGVPTIKVGNWHEEGALLETTGFNRRSGAHDDTGSRVAYHYDNSHEWKSATTYALPHTMAGQRDMTKAGNAMPRRADLIMQKSLEQASAIVDDLNNRTQKAEADDLAQTRFGGKTTLNRRNDLDRNGRPIAFPLGETAVTWQHDNLNWVMGKSRNHGPNPFAKNSSFSRPQDEFIPQPQDELR